MNFLFRSWAVVALSLLMASPSFATIIQEVTAIAAPDGAPRVVEVDRTSGATAVDITTDILATASNPSPFYDISASAGRFGAVGLSGSAFQAGRYESGASITAEYFNPLASSAQVMANFIVDGGEFELLAFLGSKIDFELALTTSIYDSNGAARVQDRTAFRSEVILETIDATGRAAMATSGDSLGSTFAPLVGVGAASQGGHIIVPLSLQSADLGVLHANERLVLNYSATIILQLSSAAEFASFEFSDPLNVSLSEPVFTPTDNPPGTVPIASTATLLMAGLMALGGCTQRRRRRI